MLQNRSSHSVRGATLAVGLCSALLFQLTYADNPKHIPSVQSQLKDPKAADVTIVGHILEPKQLPVEKGVIGVALHWGFEITVFAKDLINPRMMAVADDGTVYVTRRSVGDVLMLRDDNADGVADIQKVVARRPDLHGIAIDGDTVYLTTVNHVYRTTIQAGGDLAPLQLLVDDLPDGGQHPNRTLAVGPDGMLYVSVGSTCNACAETNPESATVLQMKPDGSSRTIFASGLRNTIGFAFEPQTGELYGMDHGIDWLGDNEQYEELNHLQKGKQYGWPYIYDDGKFNPQDEPPGDITLQEWADRSEEPVGFYTPHAAPMQMVFYTGTQFPKEYQGDAFVAMRGSWNRKPPSGYEIARVRFDGGKPVAVEAFAQGFLRRQGDQWIHQGRLAGLAQSRDGALLVADDTNGVIYRIAYTSKGRQGWPVGEPTNSENTDIRVIQRLEPEPPPPKAPQLSIELVAASSSIAVSSPAFSDNSTLPEMFAATGENISPPLTWEKGPKGTKSYAVIMEDPDVQQDPPFAHWLIYNIPPQTPYLEKAIPPVAQPAKPEGALQGANDRGNIGYFGPKPPPEDPPHHYHFQVFALDKKLDIPFGVTREELLQAMEGHVLASGNITATYDR
jgi:Raf kinase inhibitor-like YbhB/YbcL family protein